MCLWIALTGRSRERCTAEVEWKRWKEGVRDGYDQDEVFEEYI